MKCNKYQAPALFAKNAEQRDKEVGRHEILAEGHKKTIQALEAELANERDASRAEWLKGNIKHEKLMLKRYETVIAELKALTF